MPCDSSVLNMIRPSVSDDRMQGPGDVQMADLLEVRRIGVVADVVVAVVHDEQLQSDGRIALAGRKPSRLLVKTIRPPGSGQGPML